MNLFKFIVITIILSEGINGVCAFAQSSITSTPSMDNHSPPIDASISNKLTEVDSDKETEIWKLRGQATFTFQQKNNYQSAYSGQNSLSNNTTAKNKKSDTLSATAYLGTRTWEGGEFFFNPEMYQGSPFGSSLNGLGGIENGELQKGSFIPSIYYTSRAFVRQTWGLGSEREYIQGDINSHLAGYVAKNRTVLSYGKFASLDFFDKNKYSHETREDFANFSIFSMGAYGYAADSKGFTYGIVGEWYQDDWILKAARLAVPSSPNQKQLDYTLTKDYTDQFELTHHHLIREQSGSLRFLLFKQHAFMATYQDAITQGYQLNLTPNILTARFGIKNMAGYGLNLEQAINQDVGVFSRWSWNNGRTETQTLDISASISGGITINGSSWKRPHDTIGIGFALNKISSSEINYLKQGGYTMFIGDSRLNYKPEQVLEIYYKDKVYRNLFITADYQRVVNPAYNADRGPVNFYGLRMRIEM